MSATRTIPLRSRDGSVRALALVDADLYEEIAQYRWHLTSSGYAARQVRRDDGRQRPIAMHRVILALDPDDKRQGDHINGNRLDNRRANLRIVSKAEQAQNQRANGGTSRHRGVAWSQARKKWYAYARLDGKLHHLGVFDDEFDAARAAANFRAENMPLAVEDLVA